MVKKQKTHGMTKTSEHNCWAQIKQRCINPKNKYYKIYGGRGIKVCDRWLDSFENFYEDMGPKPNPKRKYSIERIDSDGNYEPSNCIWIDSSLQSRNFRPNKNNLPLGVRVTPNGGFSAGLWKKKNYYLGLYDDVRCAAAAYDDKSEELGKGRPNQEDGWY